MRYLLKEICFFGGCDVGSFYIGECFFGIFVVFQEVGKFGFECIVYQFDLWDYWIGFCIVLCCGGDICCCVFWCEIVQQLDCVIVVCCDYFCVYCVGQCCKGGFSFFVGDVGGDGKVILLQCCVGYVVGFD